jgi:hypothetical protein
MVSGGGSRVHQQVRHAIAVKAPPLARLNGWALFGSMQDPLAGAVE